MQRPTLAGRIDDADERRRHMGDVLLRLVPALSIGTADEIAMLAGANPNDRQTIKRKAERWRRNFQDMGTNLERVAILRAIVQACMDDDTLIPNATNLPAI